MLDMALVPPRAKNDDCWNRRDVKLNSAKLLKRCGSADRRESWIEKSKNIGMLFTRVWFNMIKPRRS